MASQHPAFPMVLQTPLETMQASPAHALSITQPSSPCMSPSAQSMDALVLQVLQQGCQDTWIKNMLSDWQMMVRAIETCLISSRTLYLTIAQPPVTPTPAILPVVQVMQTRPGRANNATLLLRYSLGFVVLIFSLLFACGLSCLLK